ncbi:MAG: DUF4403 family protein [Flavitalea sp.]
MKLNRWILLIVASLFFCSCSSSKRIFTATATERTLPSLPASQITIPVKVYMKPLLAKMDSMTAKEFTSDNWPNYFQPSCDFRYKYRFVRSPFMFSCVNNKVNIAFKGNYQIAGSKTVCAFDRQVSPWVSGSCGFGNEPMRKVDITISSFLELLPQYQVRTTTKVDNIIAQDKCVVSLMQTDMTKEVMDSIRTSIESYTNSFDQFIQAINNNPLIVDWRRNGNRVFPVSKYGYLNLNPSILSVSPFNNNKDTLVFSIGFNGVPQFSSDSLLIAAKKYLPSFNNTESSPGLSTYLSAVYDYQFLSGLLNDSLRNKPFEADGRTFLIKNINLAGTSDNKLLIDVSFDGYKKGTLHLSGTPLLDTAKQLLTMPDISFSVDSRDMLINIAKGLFRKKIMKKLKDQSVFDIAALIKNNKAVIEARLNQQLTEWLSTRGSFEELKLIGLLPGKNSIHLQIFIKGNITVVGSPPVHRFALK